MHWCLASRNGFLWQYGWALVQLGVLPIGYQKRYVAITMLLRGIVMAATSLKILAFIWGVGYGVQNNSGTDLRVKYNVSTLVYTLGKYPK